MVNAPAALNSTLHSAEDEPDEAGRITEAIKNIPDPEIPSLTIGDLGMVRAVEIDPATRTARVMISPTYTGCPANSLILDTVRETLQRLGFEAKVNKALFPPWTTDWITDPGRRKLRESGIAPPGKGENEPALFAQAQVPCVRCGSENTTRISQFGSTPCKALYRCEHCREPFEYFKCF